MSIQITNEQYNELLLAGLKQIAHDAEQLGSGNITHRAAQIRANAMQLIAITEEVNTACENEKKHNK
ncbi:MAG: hypothetical protein H3C41_09785 [Bacteroidales bacterium]|nr:hypothetical protein [Bacteroidales bacterium]